jgi:hypothetical protein
MASLPMAGRPPLNQLLDTSLWPTPVLQSCGDALPIVYSNAITPQPHVIDSLKHAHSLKEELTCVIMLLT